jgi:predicted outer membrane repeat protein
MAGEGGWGRAKPEVSCALLPLGSGWQPLACCTTRHPLSTRCARSRRSPPSQQGGGIYVGVEPFRGSSSDQCSAADGAVAPASVTLDAVSFSGNQAAESGGAVHVAAGTLTMNVRLGDSLCVVGG